MIEKERAHQKKKKITIDRLQCLLVLIYLWRLLWDIVNCWKTQKESNSAQVEKRGAERQKETDAVSTTHP